MNLSDGYRTFQLNTKEDTLITAAQETFPTTDYILGHEIIFNRFKKTEIIPHMLFDHNESAIKCQWQKKNPKNNRKLTNS